MAYQAAPSSSRLYESKAEADPISNPADFAAFLSGQIVGGGVSPENWIGGGAGRGLPLARRLATGAAEQAIVAAAADVGLQTSDMGAGVQDGYSATQTAGAAALGAGISTAIDAARPTSRFVRDAFTAKIEPVQPSAPTVAPKPSEISPPASQSPATPRIDVGAQPSVSGAALTAAEAPVAIPEFGIVQRVERKSPFRDLVGKAKAGETPQVVGEWLGRTYTALVSDQHPLIRAVDSLRSQTEELTGAPLDLLPSQDPRKLARGRFDWAAIGHQDLLHGVHDYGGFLNAMAAPTAVLSQTITRDPAFLLSNFIRDQVSSWIVTDVGFVPGEAVRGIADELGQTDVTRLYGVSGGISGGAATAMLGDALHKADTLALAQKGIKAKYFSSLGGLLATSEISETGTRLQVFKRAFDRAKKEGFSEYDALIEASFTARDMIDFGRAGSKMHMTRRLVTFLNAYAQGLDKALRVLGADGATKRVPLKDALRPLFSMEVAPGQMRAEDRAALQLAGRAWAKVAAVATFGAAITALFHDDPDWQQSNEKTRATHWTIPWGGNLVKVPKPFELAFLSNIVERGIEATAGRDSQAWEKMWRGLGMIFAPPTDIPVAAVAGGLASNTNSLTGRPIVPDHLQNLPPELQYQHWNSGFSQWLGGMLNVSPAKIDYAIQGFAGPFGSYVLRGMDASDPDRAEGSWTDLPVVRRFVNPSYRGSQDKRDFYDRAGAKSSELRRALNGMKEYEERGRPDAAQAIFADLDEPGKLFVTSQMGATPTRRLHPLERARVFAQEGSRIIGELNGAELPPLHDHWPQPCCARL